MNHWTEIYCEEEQNLFFEQIFCLIKHKPKFTMKRN